MLPPRAALRPRSARKIPPAFIPTSGRLARRPRLILPSSARPTRDCASYDRYAPLPSAHQAPPSRNTPPPQAPQPIGRRYPPPPKHHNHMVVVQTETGPARMDAVFHALASKPCRDMLARLADGELTVGQLAAPLTMSLAAASKHVQVLERGGPGSPAGVGPAARVPPRPGPASRRVRLAALLRAVPGRAPRRPASTHRFRCSQGWPMSVSNQCPCLQPAPLSPTSSPVSDQPVVRIGRPGGHSRRPSLHTGRSLHTSRTHLNGSMASKASGPYVKSKKCPGAMERVTKQRGGRGFRGSRKTRDVPDPAD